MRLLRFLVFPFSILYGIITAVRNKLFDLGVIKSTKFDIPVIVVGNLSTGGTGKTPQIEYLIRLLKDDYKVAVLSRGYKRKSKGFLLASSTSPVEDLGDEPFQYAQKFTDILVAVDANRTNGIHQLMKQENKPQIILLDDAFQHRKVNAGLNVLLTTYNDLYVDDFVLPTGNLREFRAGAKRAQIVIVTKCPSTLSKSERHKIESKLRLNKNQQLYFSKIEYDNVVEDAQLNFNELKEFKLLVVTGIANPIPFLDYLKINNIEFEHLAFPDHHDFTVGDVNKIKDRFETIDSEKKLILTTEKDSVRLNNKLKISHLKIKVKFVNAENDFNKTIKTYVGKSSTNR